MSVGARLRKQSVGARVGRSPGAEARNGRCLGAAAQLAAVHRILRHGPALQFQSEGVAAGARPAIPRDVAPARTGLSGPLNMSGQSIDVVQRVRVYRQGSQTDQNLCPRPGIDDVAASAARGLSTSSTAANGSRIIETDNLGAGLEAVNDAGTHYGIRPPNDADAALLQAWAATRAAGGHANTAAVRAAIVARTTNAGVEIAVGAQGY